MDRDDMPEVATGIKVNKDEAECGELLADGSRCTYRGRPALVGKHRYHAHGRCNPIKAITMTNECPG